MRKSICLLPLAAALMLSGCVSLAPDYEQPQAPVAQAWPQDEATKNAVVLTEGLQQWGDFFTDPKLIALIEKGLENNRSLRSAIMAVEQARAQYGVSRSQLFPSVAAVAEETASRTPRSVNSAGRDVTSHVYSASLGMSSYELDLFGRVRNLNEQALQAYFQTEAAQRTAQMTVVTEIAQTWLSLGAAKEQLRLATSTYESQLESLELTKKSYELGASSQLDVQQALTTVASAKTAQVQAMRAVSQYRNALTLLVGDSVDASLEPEGLVENVTKTVSAASNIPSEVLLARPDIASAEAALRSANANIGVARAAFFPSISLTGTFGTTSTELSDLFGGGTRMWSFIPNITLPIFTGGANLQTLRAAEAAQKQAVADYELAIQTAFKEVADALATEGTVADELAATQELADATAQSYKLSEDRYRNGMDSYLTVLDSQRSNFSAQQSLISAKLARATSAVTLYKVLGGGSQLVQIEQENEAKAQ
ncbi:MAG: efflux transporter outer membrane subunit [Sutterellaceae bacterium]|nr:efflux transporter outer membrane subunit [Sutterellaceae bacterium]